MQPDEAGDRFMLKLSPARFSGTYWEDEYPEEPMWVILSLVFGMLMPMAFHQCVGTWIECKALRGTASKAWVEAGDYFYDMNLMYLDVGARVLDGHDGTHWAQD